MTFLGRKNEDKTIVSSTQLFYEFSQGISWTTIRYMIGEIQYGGRVTDDYDKRLLNTFAKVWFSENMFGPDFSFYQGYNIPKCSTVDNYLHYIQVCQCQTFMYKVNILGIWPVAYGFTPFTCVLSLVWFLMVIHIETSTIDAFFICLYLPND